MSNYKLVPLEPTPEMVEAAEEAYMPFGDMDLAIRMAVLTAPDVQGEPVATVTEEVFGSDGTSDFISARLPVGTKLYTAPQPAEQQPELAKYQPCGCVICTCEHETQCQGCGAHHCGGHPVGEFSKPAYQQPGLTEALRQYQHNDGSGLVFGYDRLLVDQHVAQLVEALEQVMYCNEVGFLPDSVQESVSKAIADLAELEKRNQQPVERDRS